MKKNNIVTFLILLISLLTLAGCNPANKEMSLEEETQIYNDNIDSIEASVTKRWKHLGKVWPGLDYSNANLVITEKLQDGTKIGWVVDISGKRTLTQDELTILDADLQGVVYTPYSFEGKQTMASGDFLAKRVLPGLDAERQEHQFFELLTHESLHFYAQMDFQKQVAESNGVSINGRSTVFPFKVSPRLYRFMTIKRLQEAFVEGDTGKRAELMGNASFWYKQWKTEFPEEVKNLHVTDILEGQAFYVENLVSAITEDGIGAIDREYLLSRLYDFDAELEDELGGDAESYKLGYIAGILLDIINPSWKEGYLDNAITPAEILLADITPIADTPDPKLEKIITQQISATNKQILPLLSDLDTALENTDIPYLQLTGDDLGNYQPMTGFLLYKGTPIVGGTIADVVIDGQNLSINGVNIISPASGIGYLLPMTQKYTIEGNTISFDDETIKGKITFSTTEERDGRTIYIVE